mmetsp:Transcript_28451/g.40047  ORF Transcript_28451/g.40047 Transcript_28451/m.40047 type:complete len:654 (+) Transcript_28451:210-2171(+)
MMESDNRESESSKQQDAQDETKQNDNDEGPQAMEEEDSLRGVSVEQTASLGEQKIGDESSHPSPSEHEEKTQEETTTTTLQPQQQQSAIMTKPPVPEATATVASSPMASAAAATVAHVPAATPTTTSKRKRSRYCCFEGCTSKGDTHKWSRIAPFPDPLPEQASERRRATFAAKDFRRRETLRRIGLDPNDARKDLRLCDKHPFEKISKCIGRKDMNFLVPIHIRDSVMEFWGANRKFGMPHTTPGLLEFHRSMELPIPNEHQVRIRVSHTDLNPVDLQKLNMKPNQPIPEHKRPFVVGYGGSGFLDLDGSAAPASTPIASTTTVEKSEAAATDEVTMATATTPMMISSIATASEEPTTSPPSPSSPPQRRERVIFLCNPDLPGSYATHVVVDRRLVATVPEPLCRADQMAQLASIPVAGCTAYEALEKVGLYISSATDHQQSNAHVRSTLLIVGGAGGVGSWTCLLAKAVYPNLRIVCTASSPESVAWCKKRLGADLVIDHGEIESLGGGRQGSVDHIICLTEPTSSVFQSMAEVLKSFGKICLVVSGSSIKSLDLSFVFFKSGTVSTATVFASSRNGHVIDQRKEMEIILALLMNGRIAGGAPLMEKWWEIPGTQEWKNATKTDGVFHYLSSGHCRGKLVMKIGYDDDDDT